MKVPWNEGVTEPGFSASRASVPARGQAKRMLVLGLGLRWAASRLGGGGDDLIFHQIGGADTPGSPGGGLLGRENALSDQTADQVVVDTEFA